MASIFRNTGRQSVALLSALFRQPSVRSPVRAITTSSAPRLPIPNRSFTLVRTSTSLQLASRPYVAFARATQYSCFSTSESTSSPNPDDRQSAAPSDGPVDVDLREGLLRCALTLVPEYGWTQQTLEESAKILHLNPTMHGLCLRGPVELVEFAQRQFRQNTATYLESLDLKSIPIPARIKAGVQFYLTQVGVYHQSWPSALAWQLQGPSNVGGALDNMYELVDEIWHIAGDRATDFNWYTKRAALAGIIASSEVFMLTDHSPHFTDTWDFLDRRLDDARLLSSLIEEVSSRFDWLTSMAPFVFNRPETTSANSASPSSSSSSSYSDTEPYPEDSAPAGDDAAASYDEASAPTTATNEADSVVVEEPLESKTAAANVPTTSSPPTMSV